MSIIKDKMTRKLVALCMAIVMVLSVVGITGVIAKAAEPGEPSITYSVHAQSYGWMNDVAEGKTAGTSGESKRLEAIKIKLDTGSYEGGIEYSAHVQSIGWQNAVGNGELAGTEGKSLRVEALKIKLTGDIANYYDILYRVHVQSYGWMNWETNGAVAGTTGKAKRIEAIEIKLVKKVNTACNLTYQVHAQSYGWMDPVANGAKAGTTGESKRIEAIKINLDTELQGGVTYQAHIQSIGWQDKVSTGQVAGTEGQAKRVEAVKINLTGDVSAYYDIYYRVHVQSIGWMGWAKNGNPAGTAKMSKRIEAIEIRLVKKGDSAPGSTDEAFKEGRDPNQGYTDAEIMAMPGNTVIMVNKQSNCVTIYKGDVPVKAMICSTGEATPEGTFYMGEQYRWHLMMGDVYCQYLSQIKGNYLFHSLTYTETNNHTLITSSYNKLGTTASHGCVRLLAKDAKWIYDNCHRGTKIVVYNSPDPGPLGKPTAPPLIPGLRWDPTDPNP